MTLGASAIKHTTVSGNRALQGGRWRGILSVRFIDVKIEDSTISRNTALSGGGIDQTNFTSVILSNSTVSGNTAQKGPGGGLSNIQAAVLPPQTVRFQAMKQRCPVEAAWWCPEEGSLVLTNSTVVGNTAQTDGGGISNDGATTTLTRSMISGNAALNGAEVFYRLLQRHRPCRQFQPLRS